MKNNLIILCLLVIATSCENDSGASSSLREGKGFALEANITNISDSTMFFIGSSKMDSDLDSSYIIDGHLYLEGQLESGRPEQLLLSATDAVSKEYIYAFLIIGNEHVQFEADRNDFPWNIDVAGSVHQDHAEKFHLLEHQRQEVTNKLRGTYGRDRELFSEKLSEATDSINDAIRELIMDDPNSYAALYFFRYHKSGFSHEELGVLYDRLDEEFRESVEGRAIKLQSKYANPEVGDKYYDYCAINQNGDTVALSNINDKYILLHFSSSACYFSQLSLPEMKEIYRSHRGDLEVVSISEDISREQWLHAVEKDSIPWPYLWDGKGYLGDAVVKYWAVGTPNYFLVSPDKIIVEKWFGYRDGILEEKLKEYLK